MNTMLPALPRTFGRLTDVLSSSLGAITGQDNRLGFAKAKRVVAILVDGLGAQNLKAAGGHAPFLNAALAVAKPAACGFPSTTATSITSFATGLSAGQHGLVGYKVFERVGSESGTGNDGRAANLLTGWGADQNPLEWQPNQTVSELASSSGVQAFVIGPKAYDGSGFTQATMRGAKYLPGKTIDDRIDVAIQLLRENKNDILVYLYIPELDQTAHAFGAESSKWLAALESVDAAAKRLSGALSKADALLLTADHGIVDVPAHAHILLDEVQMDWTRVASVGGDPRVNFIYLQDPTETSAFQAQLQEQLGDSVAVFSKADAVACGLYGANLTAVALERMPDIFALAVKRVALYHRDYAPAKSLQMIGQHGALTPQEMAIPLLGWGAFSSI
jgi:predicted AlkP superfamily pyrophosphatase or phosphodiesterase